MKPLKIVNNLNVPKETKWIKKKNGNETKWGTSLPYSSLKFPDQIHKRRIYAYIQKKESAILSSAELIEQYWFHFKHSVCWFSSETEDRCSSC